MIAAKFTFALLLLIGLLAVQFVAATPVATASAAAAPEPHKRRFRGAYVPVAVAAPVYYQPQPVFVQPQPIVYAAPAPVYHHHPSVLVSSVAILGKK